MSEGKLKWQPYEFSKLFSAVFLFYLKKKYWEMKVTYMYVRTYIAHTLFYFRNVDILITCESHFGIQSKSPEGFMLVGRSTFVQSKVPRGCVAVYKTLNLEAEFDVLSTSFKDCIVVKIRYTDIVNAAMYIPPRNSLYFNYI